VFTYFIQLNILNSMNMFMASFIERWQWVLEDMNSENSIFLYIILKQFHDPYSISTTCIEGSTHQIRISLQNCLRPSQHCKWEHLVGEQFSLCIKLNTKQKNQTLNWEAKVSSPLPACSSGNAIVKPLFVLATLTAKKMINLHIYESLKLHPIT
jgi:hypothetical protein